MESLDQLNNFSSEDFRKWLETRLKDLWGGDEEKRYYSFDLRQLGIPSMQLDSHIDGLRLLFEKISTQAKVSFKEGVKSLLSTPGENLPAQGIEDLRLLDHLLT